MNCARCGAENPGQAKFCLECGEAFARRCSSCATELPAGAKFCMECGTRTPGSAPVPAGPARRERSPSDYTPRHLADKILRSKSALEGERKQVTVLFADVKGSMELAEKLDPEEWHRILDRFFEILTEGVHRFEGTVNQYTGDGIMALFGAPIAHEDHAQRACYAALHLSETLKRYADALRIERGLNFSVRMGLNSGEVVVGSIGDDLRMDYTAQGHTVGLAQRMEGLAESGRALLAASTIDIVQGYFALRDLGTLDVAGSDAPVRVAELEGVGRMRTRLDRSRARGLSRFVGRDEEMARLETALRRTLDGDGQAIGVMAEAGSGKSRLCFEFLEQCRARGITVRTTTGVPHGRALPLEPILEFYREIFGVGQDDSDTQARQKIAGSIAQAAPEELESLPLLFDFMRVPDPSRPPPELAPEERMEHLLALLRRVTAARSRREPAVLVFEDMHWMDPDSEKIIEGFVDAAVGTRTLVLMNFRPEYRAPWVGRTHYQQIALRPLDAAAAQLLLADWLGMDPSLEPFVALVCERTAGNPFFMEEVVQAQIESGGLVGVRGNLRLAHPIQDLEVPESVQSLLAARIDRLDDASKRLLQTAAVIGEQVPESLLEQVADEDAEAIRSGLRRLVEGEFLYEASLYPESEYGFKHPLTREVAHASLLRERRRALHAAVAKALESSAGEAAERHAALLAHHWEEAGNDLEAARWHERIGTRLGTNAGEAVFHWRKVIELLEGHEDDPEARTLLGQARGRIVYAASRSAAPEADVERLFAEALRGYGGVDSQEHAVALTLYALVRNGAGDITAARQLVRDAVAMARRLDDPAAIVGTLSPGMTVFFPVEYPDQWERDHAEIDRLCADDPDLGVELTGARPWVMSRLLGTQVERRRGRGAEADRLLAEARPYVEATELQMERVIGHQAFVYACARRGDPDAALEHGRLALQAALEGQNFGVQVVGHYARAVSLAAAGRLDEAREHIERALHLAIDRGNLKNSAAGGGLPVLADIELGRGDFDAARAAAERGVALSRAIGFRYAETRNLISLARAQLASGGVEGAEATFSEAEALAVAIEARDHQAVIEELRAALARHRGDEAGFESALHEAARRHRENGDEWLASRALARLAR